MKKRKRNRERPVADGDAAPAAPSPTEAEFGPPPREALLDVQRPAERSEREAAEQRATDPELTGGDPDADWQRAHMSGEEAVGGTVDTPDKDDVDAINDALGVPRAPGEPVRASSEILDRRDERRRAADE